jgi:two-component system response regulator (stage 0 sporulation protein A)
MNRIKILIVDDNSLAAMKLSESLNQNEDFEIVNRAKDGLEAIELIKKHNPDVVLLDIIMPKLDGFEVLERFRDVTGNERPIFIIFSAISQDSYITRVMNLGANYYIIKPFDENVIATRIRQWYNDTKQDQLKKNEYQMLQHVGRTKSNQDDELKMLATKFMREFGLKANMTGYFYIRDIIIESFDYYCKYNELPKGIYKKIAFSNNITGQKVERAIRNCIEKRIADDDNRLTNSQVICKLIDDIRINC